MKYFGLWEEHSDVGDGFRYAEDDLPTDDEILFAWYWDEDYSGSAYVLFRKDGKLWEVYGSHCSCYGLEDQWDPEETTEEYLKSRLRDGYFYPTGDAMEVLRKLIESL